MKKEPWFRYDEMADTIWVRADIWPIVNLIRCVVVVACTIAYIGLMLEIMKP